MIQQEKQKPKDVAIIQLAVGKLLYALGENYMVYFWHEEKGWCELLPKE